jgi:N-acetyltransferase
MIEIKKTILDGQRIRLEPLAQHHLAELAEAIRDGELWKLGFTFVPHADDLQRYYVSAEQAFQEGRELAFATIDKTSNQVVGSTRFRHIEIRHKRAEIGSTFIRESHQRTHVNTEAKYLMLKHAFEVWGINRMELFADVLNLKSRAAIARLGATEEGLLRSHMVMRDGRIRDSIVFSIIKPDWEDYVKAGLEDKMSMFTDELEQRVLCEA